MLCIEGANYPTEGHVYRSGDERGSAEDEDLLEGPGSDFCSAFVGPSPAVITKCFA